MIIEAKKLVVNFFGHVNDFDFKARAYFNLVECIQHIVGFPYGCRRNDPYVLYITQQLFEAVQNAADFI